MTARHLIANASVRGDGLLARESFVDHNASHLLRLAVGFGDDAFGAGGGFAAAPKRKSVAFPGVSPYWQCIETSQSFP